MDFVPMKDKSMGMKHNTTLVNTNYPHQKDKF